MAGVPGEGQDEAEVAVAQVPNITIEEPTGIEGSKVPTLAGMLGRVKKHNGDVFTGEDRVIINSIYPDNEDMEEKVGMLAKESVDNIVFPEEPQTPNFQQLVKLGLFRAKTDIGVQLTGRLRMTKKCADFLQTDLGAIIVWGEIMTIQKRLKDEIAGLTNAADDQITLLHFFAGIISTEPKIQEICPPGADIISFLREIMMFISGNLNTSLTDLYESQHYFKLLQGMTALGWLQFTDETKTASLSSILTEQGRSRLTAFKNLFK